MKIIDERETQKKRNNKKSKDGTDQGGTEAIVKKWELNDIVGHLTGECF